MDFKFYSMKKIVLLLFTIFAFSAATTQGNNLQFSRVIDTVLKVEVTSCTNLYSSKVFGSSITVPNNTVWKITSYSNISTVNSSTNPKYWDELNMDVVIGDTSTPISNNPCNGDFSSGNAGFKSDILKNVNGDFIVIFPSGSTNTLMPVWLNAGTELKASFYSNSSNYRYTWQAWLPYKSYVNLSIIEFNIVP